MSHLNFLILTLFAIFGLVTLLDRKLQHQIGHFEVCRSFKLCKITMFVIFGLG